LQHVRPNDLATTEANAGTSASQNDAGSSQFKRLGEDAVHLFPNGGTFEIESDEPVVVVSL
jgi:hypothetical protein